MDIFNFGKYSPSEDVKDTPYNFNKDDTEYIINTSAVSLIQENALFYQIERIKKIERKKNDQPIYEGFNDNIINDIIYVDFDNVELTEKKDALSYSDEMRALLKYGFKLQFDEQSEPLSYIKFERSGSMARDKRLSFIREDLIEKDLDKALRLDLKPENVVLSKWYAYNGLMLSSGTRINLSRFHFRFKNKKIVFKKVTGTYHLKISKKDLPIKLNKNSVIVVEDMKIDEGGVKSNLFDGEGIVSPVFADFIRKCLCYDKNNQKAVPTSFQIRMPYVKGMLHEVDFHTFAGEENIKTIIDCFGNEHNIGEVHIILTESMFKGKRWFEEHVAKECEKIENWNEKEDSEKKKIIGTKVMKHYFEKFIEYDHAIYVTGFNKPQHGRINLNYQVLSTPKLNQEKFLKLGDKTKDIYEKLMPDNTQDKEQDKNKQDVIKAFLNDVNFFLSADEIEKNDEDSDENEQIELTDDAKNTYSRYDSGIRKAVRIKPELINSKKAKNCITNMADHTLAQYGIARFLVKGVNLYLSGDLLYFLYYIFDKDMPEEEKLYNDKFYAPGVRCGIYNSNKKDKTKKKYAVLRNPHISDKELVSLNAFVPQQETKRKRYLKHLTGVLMINSSIIIKKLISKKLYPSLSLKLKNKKTNASLPPKFKNKKIHFIKPEKLERACPSIAEHLSGADYDGDIVKLVKEEEYNKAMPEFRKWSAYEFEPIPKPDVSHVEFKPGDDSYEENVYKMLAMTFGNRIGLFSNYAFKHAVHAYNANKKETTNKDATVRYTGEAVDKLFGVLGQEIDSAKTGKRPSINDELVIRGDDYFIEWKKTVRDVLEKGKLKTKAEEEFDEYPILNKDNNAIIVPSETSSKLPNFYVLPYKTLKLKGFVENKEEKMLIKPEGKRGAKKGNNHFNIGEYILNCFENHPDIDFNTVVGFAELVRKYNEAVSNLGRKKHAKLEREKTKNDTLKKNTNEYMSILFKQYNDHEKKRDIMQGIVTALKKWEKSLDKERFDKIKNTWLYSVNPEKYLKEEFKNSSNECIFSEDKIEFLCNFSHGGYKLLIIALNLAYRIDFNNQNRPGNIIPASNSTAKGEYKFEEVGDFRLIDNKAKHYIGKLFGKITKDTNDEKKNEIITKRLCYYAFCANVKKIASSFAVGNFKEFKQNDVIFKFCEKYYNEFLKSENENKEFEEFYDNFKTKPPKTSFIASAFLHQNGYDFDENENFLWSILGEDLLEVISRNNTQNSISETDGNKTNKEGSDSND